MAKKGDTLVEVTIAIGIFSMVVIAVASVMNNSTSDAQLSLETTLAREEIDAQAEALRFVHDAYETNKENTSRPLTQLWQTITDHAVQISSSGSENELVRYAPTSCNDVYSSLPSSAFVLNTRQLNEGPAAYISASGSNRSKFAAPSTYPHLIYNSDSSLLSSTPTGTNLSRAEGIYVLGVTDSSASYYDFYIRTCWYGVGAKEPSTISTVIRLSGSGIDLQVYPFTANVYNNDGALAQQFSSRHKKIVLDDLAGTRKGWEFAGWCDYDPSSSGSCSGDHLYPAGNFYNTNPDVSHYDLYPVWTHLKYTIKYDLGDPAAAWINGTSSNSQVCYEDSGTCNLPAKQDGKDPVGLTGYSFQGWCAGDTNNHSGTCSGKRYDPGAAIAVPGDFSSDRILNLKAIWKENNETITIRLTWTNGQDYDSYISGTKSDGTGFIAYYSAKNPTETVSGVTRVLASLDHDCTGSCKDETFTINTLGGRAFYYYVRNYTSNANISDAVVTVTSDAGWTQTFNSSTATGSGRIWNVFAFKNGTIVTRNIRSGGSDSPPHSSYDTGY